MNELTQIYGVASVTDQNGVVKETLTPIALALVDGPQTRVKCAVGMTINLGNFQSARIDASLEAPSNLDTDSLDKTWEFLKTWLDNKLIAMKAEIETGSP